MNADEIKPADGAPVKLDYRSPQPRQHPPEQVVGAVIGTIVLLGGLYLLLAIIYKMFSC